MDDPEGRTQEGNVLYQDTLALVEIYELGSQSILNTEDALRGTLTFLIIHWDAVFTVLQQTGTRFNPLAYHSLLPTEAGITVPGPPGFIASTAVDGSLTCDGNILCTEGIYTW